MKSFSHTSAIILSAGKSERMGEHKALLKFSDNKTFVYKITETYILAGVKQVIVVVNTGLFEKIKKEQVILPANVEIVINDKPELGRFYSLQCGIKFVKPGNHVFLQNIDNPFTDIKILIALVQKKENAEVVIPMFDGKTGHPVLFNKKIAESISKVIYQDQKINEVMKSFKFLKVEIENIHVLENINTEIDYLNAGFLL